MGEELGGVKGKIQLQPLGCVVGLPITTFSTLIDQSIADFHTDGTAGISVFNALSSNVGLEAVVSIY